MGERDSACNRGDARQGPAGRDAKTVARTSGKDA